MKEAGKETNKRRDRKQKTQRESQEKKSDEERQNNVALKWTRGKARETTYVPEWRKRTNLIRMSLLTWDPVTIKSDSLWTS